MKFKKTIGPILATMLLLIASIFFYFILSSWFNNFESSFFTSYEDNSTSKNYVEPIDLIGNNLSFKSNVLENLTILNIYDKNKNLKCSINNKIINIGYTQINISSCSLSQGDVYNIVGFGNNLNFEKNLINK